MNVIKNKSFNQRKAILRQLTKSPIRINDTPVRYIIVIIIGLLSVSAALLILMESVFMNLLLIKY